VSNTTTDVIAERPSASTAADDRGKVGNPIKALQVFGQSVWLDYLRRSLFTSGEFRRLIAEDRLRGVTSNPSIFEKAIAGSTDYLDALQDIERRRDLEPMALYEALAIRDIRGQPTSCAPSTTRPSGWTATSVWKSGPISRTTRPPRSRTRGASGRLSVATM
jgi:hypothetical protein